MSNQIKNFLLNHYNREAAESIRLLAQSGSSRRYYRFFDKDKSLILTESENVEENKSFIYFTRHFSEVIENLPEIEKISDDYNIYVQNDLGDLSLMKLLETDREAAKEVFVKSIKQLIKIQVLGDKNLDYNQCFSYPEFNYLLVLRDLFSFKNYFLNLLGIEFNHGRLLKDFEKFANDFEQIEYRYFVYRDFQSRNIMVNKNKPYFIDYQGGLKGPVQYDLVSLIWQAKANLSDEWKQEFYDLYVTEFIDTTREDLDGYRFKKAYDLCLVERLLQVLGTYGLRGIYERKPHFLDSIEFGLKNLNSIKNMTLLDNYPELKTVVSELANENTLKTLKQKINGK